LKKHLNGFLNPEGQNNLGNCYYYDKGISQNYEKAFEWYSKSAKNGCVKNNLNFS
jgi:uncharacterized protein